MNRNAQQRSRRTPSLLPLCRFSSQQNGGRNEGMTAQTAVQSHAQSCASLCAFIQRKLKADHASGLWSVRLLHVGKDEIFKPQRKKE